MDLPCEHYLSGDDDSFLLDDENAGNKKCLRCRKQSDLWVNTPPSDNNWPGNMNEFYKRDEPEIIVENLEDSPLLKNDFYRDTIDSEFHCHNVISTTEDAQAWKKLIVASGLCFFFMMAELIGGYIADSLAVMTDAAHLFSDFIGFMISLLAIWVGKKPPTKSMTFGYHRAEVTGALLSVLTVWLLAAIFSTLAINRLIKQDYEIEGDSMIMIASLGLIINIIMGAILHGVCHHGHGHGAPGAAARGPPAAAENMNVRAAAVHVLGDFVQSLGVLVAAVVIKLYPAAKLADPICTLLFSVVAVCATAKVGRDSLWYLLEGSPADGGRLAAELARVGGVRHVHNLHVWSLAPGKDAIAVHLAVDNYCDRDLVIKKATSVIQSQINVMTCTIQVELYNPELINTCRVCQNTRC